MRDDANVRAGARLLYGTDVLFKDLVVGEQFRFPKADQLMVKTSQRGSYRHEGTASPVYTTGLRTAVERAA